MDDTTSGIVAGLNAGCWTVGVAKTVMNSFLNLNISDQMKNLQGNYVGMTEAEMEKCDTVQLEKKIENARNILYKVVINFNTTTSLNRRLKAYQNFHNNFSFLGSIRSKNSRFCFQGHKGQKGQTKAA